MNVNLVEREDYARTPRRLAFGFGGATRRRRNDEHGENEDAMLHGDCDQHGGAESIDGLRATKSTEVECATPLLAE
jgi:hypothetical protein